MVAFYRTHRAERLEQVRAALAEGGARRRGRGGTRVRRRAPRGVARSPAERGRPAGVPAPSRGRGQRARRLSRSTSSSSTARASRRSQPRLGEVGEGLVDRLARGADELGQLLLREVVGDEDAVLGRATEAAGQVEQGLGDTTRHVREDEVGQVLVGAAQPPGQGRQQDLGDLGPPGQQAAAGPRGRARSAGSRRRRSRSRCAGPGRRGSARRTSRRGRGSRRGSRDRRCCGGRA